MHAARLALPLCLSLVLATATRAADPPEKQEEKKENKVDTKHVVTAGGQKLTYTATAGTLPLRNEKNEPTAEIFYMAYQKDGVADRASRPVTFSFNGGPGSSSVWLHLGLLGPRRVVLEQDGMPVPPPYRLVDNEHTLLAATDLVFIDPVSTGFSRAVKPEDAKSFHGVDADLRSVADFIRLWTTRNERWTSPKFIIGESYGTTRAAGLSGELREQHRMNVNGIMLVSTILNFQTARFDEGNDLPYVLFLPTYAATAWHHRKLPADLQSRPLTEVLAEAERFAAGDYSRALFLGTALPAGEREQALRQLARLTGLAEAYLDRANLRVSAGRFGAELLREEGKVIGRFDSRYSGVVRDGNAEDLQYDPSGEAIFSPYASTLNHYLRAELKYESDLPYEILTGAVHPWDWGRGNAYVDTASTLAESLTRNRFLKVHVSNGWFDLATPYYAAIYTMRHLGLPPEIERNITIDHYTAGHMMYVNLPDLAKQSADLTRFIRAASGSP